MTDIIDYAGPLIRIERFVRDIHEMCVDTKYDDAQERVLQLGAEVRYLHHTLELMKEKQLGYYKTNPTHPQENKSGQQSVLSGNRRDHAPQGRNGSRVLRRQKD